MNEKISFEYISCYLMYFIVLFSYHWVYIIFFYKYFVFTVQSHSSITENYNEFDWKYIYIYYFKINI